MNKDEAIQFYTVKQESARNEQHKYAYNRILLLIKDSAVIEQTIRTLHYLIEKEGSSERRAIYRKALQELSV